MIFKKREENKQPLTGEEKKLRERIKKAYWKLFPWTLLNIIPGILIGYFTWFYYFKVILDKRIVLGEGGFEQILGFLLLWIAPIFSILGLVSISVTIIAKLTYRPIIIRLYYDERKVNNNLWNASVIVNVFVTLATLLIRHFA